MKIQLMILITVVLNGCSVVGGAIKNVNDQKEIYGNRLNVWGNVDLEGNEFGLYFQNKVQEKKVKNNVLYGNKNSKIIDAESDHASRIDNIDSGAVRSTDKTNIEVIKYVEFVVNLVLLGSIVYALTMIISETI